PSCVHSRTYTGLPSTGNPLTVAARLVPCPWLYTLKLPGPVVPTDSEYCVETGRASRREGVTGPGRVGPVAGLVTAAVPWRAAGYAKSLTSPPPPPPSCVHSRTYTGLPSTGSPLTVAARLVPCPWLYTLKLPGPVVPTDSEYCVATRPAPRLTVITGRCRMEPGAGHLTTAVPWHAAV